MDQEEEAAAAGGIREGGGEGQVRSGEICEIAEGICDLDRGFEDEGVFVAAPEEKLDEKEEDHEEGEEAGEHGEEAGGGEEEELGCGEEEKSPRYETAAEESDHEDVPHTEEEDAAAAAIAQQQQYRAEQQRRRAKLASKKARQRAALQKHVERCASPRSPKQGSAPPAAADHPPARRKEKNNKHATIKTPPPPPASARAAAEAVRSTAVRLEIDRGAHNSDIVSHPRSISLRLDDLMSRGSAAAIATDSQTTLSRSPKRTRSHGDIEIIRIEAPEASGPSYSSVVFPMPYMSGDLESPGSFSEMFPAATNLPPEPQPGRPVKCPPTDRDANVRRKTSKDKRKGSGGRRPSAPSFVPRAVAEKSAWKSGICDCWRDPESYSGRSTSCPVRGGRIFCRIASASVVLLHRSFRSRRLRTPGVLRNAPQ